MISPQHTFVVRMWAEATASDGIQWRGSVEHIASAQKFYFTSPGDLISFIEQHLGASFSFSRAEPPSISSELA